MSTPARMLVGLIGKSIGHSLAPALHEDAFAACGMAGHYHLMDCNPPRERRLPDVLAAVREAGFAGVNITFPFKEAVIPLLDEVSAEAREIGAVNTVVIDRSGRTSGHNTDRSGFREAFRETLGAAAAAGQDVLLLGAGGAGRAVAFALRDLGAARIRLYDRDLAKARQLAADVGGGKAVVLEAPEPALKSVSVIVNATPIGMSGHEGLPMPTAGIEARHVVADVIYSPLETQFLKAAKAAGARTMGGAGMCVHQAVEAFRLFTGTRPDVERMRATFIAGAGRRAPAP
jgi:shikimate dehydrogenase